MTTNGLYGKKDWIGWLLSAWRTRAVLPMVQGKLVDLSCGDNRMVKRYGGGTGVDITDHGPADVVLGDYRRLPFPDASVDTVTVVASLNYFEYPVQELKEIRRVLSPTGRLIITLTNEQALRWWHAFRRSQRSRHSVSHGQLKNYLREAGFEVLSEKPFMLFLNRVYLIKPLRRRE